MRLKHRTIVLLCGYARSGKDTFAQGMMQADGRITRKAYADCLKSGANNFMSDLRLFSPCDRNFFEESFKVKHRDILVTLGTFARSINPDVFVDNLCADVVDFRHEMVVVPDCRYANEISKTKELLEPKGWKVHVIQIETDGVTAANPEEWNSIDGILESGLIDETHRFDANSADNVIEVGRKVAPIVFQL